MRIDVLMALTLAVSLLGGAGAQAPQTSPVPPQAPAAPPAAPAPAGPADYGPPIDNAQAKLAAAAAIAEAQKSNLRVVIAIVGPAGELVYLEKMDGTQRAGVPLAQRKARPSALFRRPSKAFADQFAAGNTGFMSFPDDARPIASEGGIPIIINGRLIGAIGASGGPGQQDGVASAAGANAVR